MCKCLASIGKLTVMPTSLKVSVTTPCHENWQDMTPTNNGRHCNACAKEVVDFTAMSDAEVLQFFTSRKKENVCGRFYADQLNREIKKTHYPERKRSWYWNCIMLLLLLFKSNTGSAQEKQRVVCEQGSRKDADKSLPGVLGMATGESSLPGKKISVTGQVTDGDGVPIPGAMVTVQRTGLKTTTDAAGEYELNNVVVGDILVVSTPGLNVEEVQVDNTGRRDCMLNTASVLGGLEVVVVGYGSAGYDYSPAFIPVHTAVIEVKDNTNHLPLNATITIRKGNSTDNDVATTNKKGIYKLRRIEESDSYKITVSAPCYKEKILYVNGARFSSRKETRYAFLEKEQTDSRNTEKRIIVGMASEPKQPALYVVDGVIWSQSEIEKLEPGDIATIDILKGATATALYGIQGRSGVILITTKGKAIKQDAAGPVAAVANKEHRTNGDKQPVLNTGKTMVIPNPVQKGNLFAISFSSKLTGECTIIVSNISGASMLTQKMILTGKDNLISLETNANWAAGIYAVSVCDPGNIIITSGSFMVQ